MTKIASRGGPALRLKIKIFLGWEPHTPFCVRHWVGKTDEQEKRYSVDTKKPERLTPTRLTSESAKREEKRGKGVNFG